MSTSTTSTLNANLNQNQAGNGTPVNEAKTLAVKLPTGNTPGINGGFTVDSQLPAPVATYVHGKEFDGDRGGDTRVNVSQNFSTAFAKNPPGPRDGVCQSQVTSSKLQEKPVPVPEAYTGESEASQN